MLTGRYRDVLSDADGRRLRAGPWRPNLVLDGAYELLAALLKREPGVEGILQWAVGAGGEDWDAGPPPTLARTTRLEAEVDRRSVPPDAIRYVDAGGAETPDPSAQLEVSLAFVWPERAVTLREFGLFGGGAGEEAGSGTMINHVIHPRVDLAPGQRLSRELRLALGRAADARWADLPEHGLGATAPRAVAGVGARFAPALSGLGITTIDALARSDPHALAGPVPLLLLVEFRAKARLVLRIAAELRPPVPLHEATVGQVLRTAPRDLARETGVFESQVVLLREQLATLELALDHAFLGRRTLRSLAGSAS